MSWDCKTGILLPQESVPKDSSGIIKTYIDCAIILKSNLPIFLLLEARTAIYMKIYAINAYTKKTALTWLNKNKRTHCQNMNHCKPTERKHFLVIWSIWWDKNTVSILLLFIYISIKACKKKLFWLLGIRSNPQRDLSVGLPFNRFASSTKTKSTSKLHGFKNSLQYLWTSWSSKNEDLC